MLHYSDGCAKATVQSSGNEKNVDQERFSHLHRVPRREGVWNFLGEICCVGDLRKELT